MVSINTNLSALSAQQSLKTAANLTTASSTRLSSGNRIDKASTDVAGLSVGTILATNVSTLRQGLQNAGQASSLLQVADGGLKNISDILQRQKALAVQATSGTLSDTERGYLNQEFQSLTEEIDRTVANTKFSSVTLLDGSLSKQTAATIDTTLSAAGTAVATAAAFLTITGVPATNGVVYVNGVPITFAASTDTVESATAAGKVIIGATVTATAQNVVRFLNNSDDARLSNLYFTNTNGAISAEWAGGELNAAATTGIAVAGTGITNVTGATTAVAYSANALDGLGLSRTFATGRIGSAGLWLASGVTTLIGSGSAIDLSNVERTGSFVGKLGDGNIGEFKLTYVAANSVIFSLKVGDITYSSAATTTNGGAALAITLTGRDSNNTAVGGSFIINTTGNTTTGAVASQAEADVLAEKINTAFKDVTFTANRDIKSFVGGGTVTNSSGVSVGSLNGLTANLRSSDFSNVQIGDISIVAPGVGQSDATITVKINGEKYVSYSGIGSKIATNTILAFRNVNDSSKAFSIITGAVDNTGATQVSTAGTALDLSTQDNADAIAAALEAGFGAEDGNAVVNFQIGSTSEDAIGVEVKSAYSYDLYNGKSLAVDSATNAAVASTQLDKAIQTIASFRADVGALQSRFSYASTQLDTSIQNLDAARGTFLDTDVSAESTLYAQSQVKLQASISVLAQANQLPQNLLKLLA